MNMGIVMTRSANRLAVLCVLLCCCAAAGDKPKWKSFASVDGRFEVLMPGQVKSFDTDVANDLGPSVLHMNVATAGETMYVANWVDFPRDAVNELPDRMLDDSREGALENLDGELVSEKKIKLGQHPGREIVIKVEKLDRLFHARVYLVENRLYQVLAFGPPDVVKSRESQKFLDSFKLMKS